LPQTGAPAKYDVPKEMKAIRYNKVKDFSLVTMPVPEPKAHEILIKGMLNLLSLTFKL
jgi:D-arabinitol dehydrogenase (NADP+)